MRISDWSSDVCYSDLHVIFRITNVVLVFPTYSPLWQGPEYIFTIGGHMNTYSEAAARVQYAEQCIEDADGVGRRVKVHLGESPRVWLRSRGMLTDRQFLAGEALRRDWELAGWGPRSEEHTSEIQSLMRISYAVCCLEKTNK